MFGMHAGFELGARIGKEASRGVSPMSKLIVYFLLVCVACLTGCATRHNLRPDLVCVTPQGTLTVAERGTNQILLARGAVFPPRYKNAMFRDLNGAKLPLDSSSYICTINDYGTHGVLWIEGRESGCRYAPCFELIDYSGDSSVGTNAVVLQMTSARVRRYTFLSLTRKILMTPVMMCCDLLSFGMTAWVYADTHMSVVGEYEFCPSLQTAPVEDRGETTSAPQKSL